MRFAAHACVQILVMFVLWTPGWSTARESVASLGPDRQAEASLLHRRIDWSMIETMTPGRPGWRPNMGVRGKVLVINLWSRSCEPCLREMSALSSLQTQWQRWSDRELLLVASPPDEMTREVVEEFYRHPIVTVGPGQPCPGQPRSPVAGAATQTCVLDLPQGRVGRAVERLETKLQSELKPITLLIDPDGNVRQAFVGSIAGRTQEIANAVDRLVALLRAGR